jgi:hypothetical protein
MFLKIQDEIVGTIEVYYLNEFPESDEGPFLKEERKLLNTIAERIGNYLLQYELKQDFKEMLIMRHDFYDNHPSEWSAVIEILKRTDQHLFSIIAKKMINILFFRNFDGASELIQRLGNVPDPENLSSTTQNRPSKKRVMENSYNLGNEIFELASKHLHDSEILALIQKWIYEDRSNFLLKALSFPNTSMAEIADSIRKYHHMGPLHEKSSPISTGIRAALVRRFLTDQLQFINIAKNFTDVSDLYSILDRMIYPSESHGKLGGKSSGLLLAKNIVQKRPEHAELLANVKIPKTWYIPSDGIMNFISYNNLEDVMEQKYKDIEQIRQEYPHITQIFKNSQFSPEMINGLSRALDDFGEKPIIVRSSSLLEDRMGAAFAGKYKSLFLANQGSKQQRLDALCDAIAEVYSSTFGPDPIGYRYEKGLLDFNEEMGIMIQEVVGKRFGKYFFPAFGGVAFSNNEFRWSSRITREDGLIRLVPGLGTRAVDRIGDDYPVLIAPGQPNLRLNLSFEEIINYSPKNMDVINLETNSFETISIRTLVKEVGNSFPLINETFSIQEDRHLRKPVGLGIDTNKHDIIVTFENLITNTDYIKQIHTMLQDLKIVLDTPIDLEFACDGENLYLLQCRPQSHSGDSSSAVIPKNIAPDRIVFSANKYISDGLIEDVHYIVYVDPASYGKHSELSHLKDVGRAIGKLNKILPEKKFILMGPGRWGSRDDIRLGVNVTYSDINRTSLLVEIARKKGNYIPDLSFGTHFFQDLVESSIRYLPLYPDEQGIAFNEGFLLNSFNELKTYLPEFQHIQDTVRLIDVQKVTNGQVLRVLMNASEDKAVGLLTDPSSEEGLKPQITDQGMKSSESLQGWRLQTIESLSVQLRSRKLGVKKLYVLNQSVDKKARPFSDIDIYIHFDGNAEQKKNLNYLLEGWNQCLTEINSQKSGYRVTNFLDVKTFTDFDVENDTVIYQQINSSKDTFTQLI